MSRMLRNKKIWGVAIFAICVIVSARQVRFRLSDEDFVQLLEQTSNLNEIEVNYHTHNHVNIRYVSIENKANTLLVFVHGSPSSSWFWTTFLKDNDLLANASMLAIDRPGYGYSNFGVPMISVKNQAEHIAPIIWKYRNKYDNIVLVGSSYGGTVVARLLMDEHQLADGALFISSSFAPGEEKTYWISYPTQYEPLKWMMPTIVQVASSEKLNHKASLLEMGNLWNKIDVPLVFFHGTDDGLIYPSNLEFALDRVDPKMVHEVIEVPERGHDLMFTEPDLIKTKLIEFIGSMNTISMK
ncbi:MAG: alpha/beta hydrolase [Cyclobacteriaceae bacterium]